MLYGQNVTVADILNLPQPAADHRIHYGSDPLQFGDLYLPVGSGPVPLLIFIHGGCWRSQYTLSHTASFADTLRKSGLAVWNIEYRKSGDPGSRWPDTFLDVAKGIDYVTQLASRYPIDLDRIVVSGHSAGACLALWAASRDNIPASSELHSPDPLPIRAVVALAGAGDMFRLVEDGVCEPALEDVLGGRPEEVPEHYEHASPERFLPLDLKQILIYGENDPIVSLKYGEEYMRRAGSSAEMIVLPEAGHFEMISPETDEFRKIKGILLGLVKN
jgi:acetyl esterase/lipase